MLCLRYVPSSSLSLAYHPLVHWYDCVESSAREDRRSIESAQYNTSSKGIRAWTAHSCTGNSIIRRFEKETEGCRSYTKTNGLVDEANGRYQSYPIIFKLCLWVLTWETARVSKQEVQQLREQMTIIHQALEKLLKTNVATSTSKWLCVGHLLATFQYQYCVIKRCKLHNSFTVYVHMTEQYRLELTHMVHSQ